MKDFRALLARIDAGLERGLIDQRSAAHYVGAHLARRLYCSRVALWTITDAPGRATLTRLGGYDALLDRPLGEIVTLELHAPSAWLGELLSGGTVAIDDVASDRRLHALRDAWLAPQGVGALLQSAIAVDGHVQGFIGCEQVGEARAWARQDGLLLRRVAGAIAQRRGLRSGRVPALEPVL